MAPVQAPARQAAPPVQPGLRTPPGPNKPGTVQVGQPMLGPVAGVEWLDFADLLTGEVMEFWMLVGKDHTGKTTGSMSLALKWERDWMEQHGQQNTTWWINTEGEGGFKKIFRPFYALTGGPVNIKFFDAPDAYSFSAALDHVAGHAKKGDALIVDSASTLWELAQDRATHETAGMGKDEYLELRRKRVIKAKSGGLASPIPQGVNRDGEDYWKIANGFYLGVFLGFMTSDWAGGNLHRVITAQLNKPSSKPGQAPNADRLKWRNESGIDMDIAGSPKLPYKPDSAVMLERKMGQIWGVLFRDRGSVQTAERTQFLVANSTDFAWNLQAAREAALRAQEAAQEQAQQEAAQQDVAQAAGTAQEGAADLPVADSGPNAGEVAASGDPTLGQ